MYKNKPEKTKKRARKRNTRRTVILLVALLLAGGLVFNATFGFMDYMVRGEQPGMAPEVGEWQQPLTAEAETEDEEDKLTYWTQYAESMEQSLQENPDDVALIAELGYAYYQVYYQYLELGEGQGEEGAYYAQNGKEMLIKATEKGFAEYWAPLLVAMLFMMQAEEPEMAEDYFKKSLVLDADHPETHLYYGIFLSSGERLDEAREHWERVIEVSEEQSMLSLVAQMHLQNSFEPQEPAEE